MYSQEEINDKVKHEQKFELTQKAPNAKPEKFPGNFSVEENLERVERIFSETNKSGAALHIRENGNPSRFSIS